MFSDPNGREQEVHLPRRVQNRLILGAVAELLRSFDRRKFRVYY